MMGFDRLKRKWLRFQLEDAASVSVEAVLMAPLMVWAFVTTLQFFDAYRAELISTKAAVTIADMYSREDKPVNPQYLNGTRSLLRFLTLAEDQPDYRVTVFYWHKIDDDNGEYRVVWSRNRGSRTSLKTADIQAKAARLPKLSEDERALLLETWTDYTPKFGNGVGIFMEGTGLKPLEFSTFIVTSPRFTHSVCWQQNPNAKIRC